MLRAPPTDMESHRALCPRSHRPVRLICYTSSYDVVMILESNDVAPTKSPRKSIVKNAKAGVNSEAKKPKGGWKKIKNTLKNIIPGSWKRKRKFSICHPSVWIPLSTVMVPVLLPCVVALRGGCLEDGAASE
eukprot:GHVU01004765.1.p2 GENE.GHVU01004765.1~~GHVU01004765.1.p2  ORF type:complete len:132 (+),score=7.12 GHVU01004765.1:1616-2011(+)